MTSFDPDHVVAHVASGGAIVATMFGHLPSIAAAIGGAWYALQVWESKTVQDWRATKAIKSWWHSWFF